MEGPIEGFRELLSLTCVESVSVSRSFGAVGALLQPKTGLQ